MREIRINERDISKRLFEVKNIKYLTSNTYVLELFRNGFQFRAGQYVYLGIPGKTDMREYSVYSGEMDDTLQFLIKEVRPGDLSVELKKLKRGSMVKLDGPAGNFVLQNKQIYTRNYLFISTGTGISPFRSYIRTYPDIKYKIIHGIRMNEESFHHRAEYVENTYISCISREKGGDFQGRVTEYLKQYPLEKKTLYYLCGNSGMINDSMDILQKKGVPTENMFMEVYF